MHKSLLSLICLTALACAGDSEDTGSDEHDDHDGEHDDEDTGEDTDDSTARVRVLHLSPDAPAVDVFVNAGADATVSALAFEAGTDYLEVPAGTYDFQVAASGATAADAVLNIDGLALDADVSYTAVAYGALADISAMALVDDSEGIEAGNIRLQVSHAASGVGTVDIWELTGGSMLVEAFEYGATGTLDVPGGALELGLDLDADASPDVTFSVPDLGADVAVNVFAVTDATGAFLLAQLPDGSTARVDAN